MPRFKPEDVESLEKTPMSPGNLRNKIASMLVHSTRAQARVESVNWQTGEYRIVLQGTLDKESAWTKET